MIDLFVVLDIAELAKISFTPDEIKQMQNELGKIIEYMDKVRELNPSNINVEPLFFLRLRDDNPVLNLTPNEVFFNAQSEINNYFLVPKIL